MSGSRDNEHVITMRRPSAGIRWRVTHRESMTQAAGDLQELRRSARLRVIKAQIEPAGQFMFSPLDLQAADGPPSGRDPGQQLGPEADLREGPGVQEAGPGQQPVQPAVTRC